MLHAGVQQVRVVLRALALRQFGKGSTAPRIAQALLLTAKAIREIAYRYQRGGLDRALYDQQRPGAQPLLDDSQKQRVVAMVCGKPPEGWEPLGPAHDTLHPQTRKLAESGGDRTQPVLAAMPRQAAHTGPGHVAAGDAGLDRKTNRRRTKINRRFTCKKARKAFHYRKPCAGG